MKNGYEHYMLKEIHEQPQTIRETLNQRLNDGLPNLDINIDADTLKNINRVYIIGCGTAYYAGMNAKLVMEHFMNINVDVDIASEFCYRNPLIDENTLVIFITQSGETADTLSSLRLALEKKARTISIVNVVDSSIARESENTIYTCAGPEIAVASTKVFTAQLITLYLLAIDLGLKLETISLVDAKSIIEELHTIPGKAITILEKSSDIEKAALEIYEKESMYFIGRNVDYPAALEGSLKLKETSYIHSEGLAAGELKHGPISLVEEGKVVVYISTVERLHQKAILLMEELIAKGAKTIMITNEPSSLGEFVFEIPKTNELFGTVLSVIPLQLLAYNVAKLRNCDIDNPKNLSKSVNVE